MTREEKDLNDLLLKDLCSRLPYGVKISINDKVESLQGINILDNVAEYGSFLSCDIEEVRPYLLPLSSMTEEQREEIEDKLIFPNTSDGGWIEILYNNKYEIPFWFVDFCNKNHFDYRGLIPKGLAIDATGLNIYKEE